MASLYDSASLVMIPSGVKEDKLYSIKPTDGSGDFTFSRGSDIQATRVNSSGLIEKAKVNLLTYSNTFSNAAWTNSNTTETGGQTGYDGTSDAWLLEKGATSFSSIFQPATISGVYIFSVYAKAGTASIMTLRDGSNQRALFDLSDGSVDSTAGSPVDAKIEAVSGATGWYRCSITMTTTNPNLQIYVGWSDTTAGNIYIQDAALYHGLIAQDYVETTTTAVVEGLTADLPRLDYSGGASCPSLLLEPSRTNLVLHSEYIGSLTPEKGTITSNADTSPEGVVNATSFVEDSTTGRHRTSFFESVTSGTTYTFSMFAKIKSGTRLLCINNAATIGARAYFDLVNGDVEGVDAGTASIENYGNGWYRCSVTATSSVTGNATTYFGLEDGTTDNGYAGDGTSGHYWYGLQLEAGSYPTSYIPTYGTAANRAFEYPQVNPQTMLGATEGSWFVNFDDMAFDISGTSSPSLYLGYNLSNFVGIANRASGNVYNVQFIKRESGAITNIHTLTPQVGNDKFCFTWNGSNLKLFVNGVKVYDDNGFANYIAWDDFSIGYSTRVPRYNNKQTLLFPTQLTDAEAIALTTI